LENKWEIRGAGTWRLRGRKMYQIIKPGGDADKG